MKVVLIDNYDSFVYNIAQYLGAEGADPVVLRNDASIEDIEDTRPDALVISPGPGRPEDAGCSVEAARHFSSRIPVLGVCLGHQAIGVAFGAQVCGADRIMHGKTSQVHHGGEGILGGLPDPFEATRYHSLVIDPATLPETLEVTASTDDGVIMAVRHRERSAEGVQFHPESVLTPYGRAIVRNFLSSPATPRPRS